MRRGETGSAKSGYLMVSSLTDRFIIRGGEYSDYSLPRNLSGRFVLVSLCFSPYLSPDAIASGFSNNDGPEDFLRLMGLKDRIFQRKERSLALYNCEVEEKGSLLFMGRKGEKGGKANSYRVEEWKKIKLKETNTGV
ncbi:hypothetical protein RRG08_017387 [Elysia crispata]|uniref:Uncharacterized protein n=1 Tax=Elysia crispata TaxID=231223 RepID=A0AAE0Z6F2_9GAST|nr:hypothetical protein RRG08_017387 [Elysia crispata]